MCCAALLWNTMRRHARRRDATRCDPMGWDVEQRGVEWSECGDVMMRWLPDDERTRGRRRGEEKPRGGAAGHALKTRFPHTKFSTKALHCHPKVSNFAKGLDLSGSRNTGCSPALVTLGRLHGAGLKSTVGSFHFRFNTLKPMQVVQLVLWI